MKRSRKFALVSAAFCCGAILLFSEGSTKAETSSWGVGGFCVVKDRFASSTNRFDPLVGRGYARLNEDTTGIVNLRKACTKDDYVSLIREYCSRNRGPFTLGIEEYNGTGKIISSASSKFGAGSIGCPGPNEAVKTNVSGGVCLVRSLGATNETSTPSMYDARTSDGKFSYLLKENASTTKALTTACTMDDFNSLFEAYCTAAKNPASIEVGELGPFGSVELRAYPFGSGEISCPVTGTAKLELVTKGLCVVRIPGSPAPNLNSPLVGTQYALSVKSDTKTLADLSRSCKKDDYSKLLTSFCALNPGKKAELAVVLLNKIGGVGISGCGSFGCNLVQCPGAAPIASSSTATLITFTSTTTSSSKIVDPYLQSLFFATPQQLIKQRADRIKVLNNSFQRMNSNLNRIRMILNTLAKQKNFTQDDLKKIESLINIFNSVSNLR